MFCKKGFSKNFAKFTGKHLCQGLFFNKVACQTRNFIKKETLAQVFFCEFCEISKNTFSYRTPLNGCFCLLNKSSCTGVYRKNFFSSVTLLVQLASINVLCSVWFAVMHFLCKTIVTTSFFSTVMFLKEVCLLSP